MTINVALPFRKQVGKHRDKLGTVNPGLYTRNNELPESSYPVLNLVADCSRPGHGNLPFFALTFSDPAYENQKRRSTVINN